MVTARELVPLATALCFSVAGCNAILGIDDVSGPDPIDAAVDAPPGPPTAPALRSPRMGATTGSVHAAASLRPHFAWRPVAGATRYELAVDDSCEVSSFQTCVFPSPELDETDLATAAYVSDEALPVALSPPVGRRYYWRVRACNDQGCGDWSATWYLDVGRLADDVNGDGYGDLVVGMLATADGPTTIGSAYLVFGNAEGIPSTIVTLRDPIQAPDARFGNAVAMVGDLNADGYGDVAIGAWRSQRTKHNGFVFVYLGRGTWPATVDSESTGYGLATDAPADFLGSALAGRGDINGDGYCDIAMAAVAREDPNSVGHVYVSLGRAALAGAHLGADVTIPDPTGGATSVFGRDISMGDFDEDGLSDVIIGAPGVDDARGAVVLYRGRRDLTPTPLTIDEPDVLLSSPAPGVALFGMAATVCKSPDAMPALAVGSPQEDSPGETAGGARIYAGRDMWPRLVTTADRTLPAPTQSARDAMGSALACDDVLPDGDDDLIVSAPTGDDVGALYVYSRAAALPMTANVTLTQQTSGTLGYSVATTDFNGDGTSDVFASAPRANGSKGVVAGWLGRSSWPSIVDTADLTIENPTATAGERFGDSLE
ncbi:MAG TPA: hypothetical protein VHE35_22910 [Kofleriaceae bacterium]|nr:hypothetical protein [Kofleriaceae bacterium]